jgi:phosphoribosyl-ATP pyrophosphohydrolase
LIRGFAQRGQLGAHDKGFRLDWNRPFRSMILGGDADMPTDTLERLAATIHARRSDPAGKSYTRQLLEGGTERCAKKLGEEAIEVVIATVHQSDAALTAEAADLLYHLLVVLEVRNIPLAAVSAALENRMGTSGLDEKAARNI